MSRRYTTPTVTYTLLSLCRRQTRTRDHIINGRRLGVYNMMLLYYIRVGAPDLLLYIVHHIHSSRTRVLLYYCYVYTYMAYYMETVAAVQIFREAFCRRRRLRSAMGFCAVDRSALAWGGGLGLGGRTTGPRHTGGRTYGPPVYVIGFTATTPRHVLLSSRSCVLHFVIFLSLYFLFVFFTRNDIIRFLVQIGMCIISCVYVSPERCIYIYIYI